MYLYLYVCFLFLYRKLGKKVGWWTARMIARKKVDKKVDLAKKVDEPFLPCSSPLPPCLILIRRCAGRNAAQVQGTVSLEIESGRVVFKGPLTLLVNRGTSGAAEILGSAFHHAERGELVGERTAGRGAVQKAIPLKDGSGLILSVSQYSTPGGEPLLGTGLEPTVEAEASPQGEDGGGDPALEKAIEILSAGRAKAAA